VGQPVEDPVGPVARFSVVMFTDIKGSTAYYSASGDVAGRRKVQRHDELTYPLVASHGGEVLDHTGDGILAVFDEPSDACRAGVRMMEELAQQNAALVPSEELHIRVALHAGVGLREQDRVFGTIVNTASRIESVADGDQIVLSQAVYAHLDDELRSRCRFLEERELRGTGRVHRLYELVWRPEPDVPRLGWAAEAWLATDAGAPPEALRSPRRRAALTALCTDVEGSRALGEWSPSAVPLALRRVQDVIRSCVARYRGEVQRAIADIVHATFRDGALACDAAIEIQRALSPQRWGAAGGGLAPPRLRVSLHTGEPDEDQERVVERAARLGSAGHGGQILLTASAWREVRGRLPPAVGVRSHGTRALQDSRFTETIVELLVPDLPAPDPVLRTPAGEAETGPVAVAVDEDRDRGADLQAGREPAPRRPADLEQYLLSRVVEWSKPRWQLDARFVQLSLLVDRGEDVDDERWRLSEQALGDVGDLLEGVPQPALVILGPPGSGKSTILRRLEMEISQRGLHPGAADGLVPFLVELNLFAPEEGDAFPAPEAWLGRLWADRYPDLPPLDALIASGRLLLLLDGLNEIPTGGEAATRRCIRRWKVFLERTVTRSPGNRFVFSCRSLDYSAPLSSPSLRVPQVRIEPMSDAQVRQYLKLYSPLHWAEIWAEVNRSSQLELFRSPFFLKLLIDQVEAEGRIPQGRSALFTGFVRQSLKRELERDNPVFDDDELVAVRDRRRVVGWQWRDPYALPDRGALIPLLERLAYRMQEDRGGGRGGQVRIDLDDAIDLLESDRAEAALAAGGELSVLDEDTAGSEVLFTHQLMQEYFAARRLARAPTEAPLAVPWREGEVSPPLRDVLRALPSADRLPPPPASGWEETAVLAAPMAPDPSAFVQEVADVDLVLAGRCAAQGELSGRLEPKVVEALRSRLAERSRDRGADLRARIASGLALGWLGGPCYEEAVGPAGRYLLPPVVPVAGGEYRIGSEEPYRWNGADHTEELPAGPVVLAPFALGRFAVTNAEWAAFMAAGGYEDEAYWEGAEARAWLQGEGTVVNVRSMARWWRRRFREEPGLVERELERDHMDQAMYELWHRRLAMDDERFERHLLDYYPAGPLREPRFWRDARYNNPMQPVIGISCFEARAYAAWLAAQSGRPFRLPTEAEWEAAARGPTRRRFAYGDEFDPLKGNTVETHVRAPTPVGVFPEGDTPEGIADLTGNTYDLTSSLWGDDPLRTSWPYPYRADDGREAVDVPVTVSRVGRGGAWYLGRVHARASYRGRDRYDLRPDEWLNFRGCRVAMDLDG
jgi:class 3 adenylate cyclase/formylglycine-generating enzyme required for sulfatase activity